MTSSVVINNKKMNAWVAKFRDIYVLRIMELIYTDDSLDSLLISALQAVILQMLYFVVHSYVVAL